MVYFQSKICQQETHLEAKEVQETEDLEEIEGSKENSAVVFSLRNQVGGLVRALRVFKVSERAPSVPIALF